VSGARRAGAAALGTALPWTAARSALACSVCGASTTETAMAFLWMTLLLSALPLLMIGGGVFWLWSRAQAEDRRAQQALERYGLDSAEMPVASAVLSPVPAAQGELAR
jgi:hypothetical protein